MATEAHASARTPQRIVSLNPCLDAILVHVADRAQIGALSHYAREAQSSPIAELAQDLPVTFETAEEIVALSPDLVLASTHSAVATRRALDRLGVEVATFAVPNTVAESVAQIRDVAGRVGQPARGEALVGRIERALHEAAPRLNRPPVRALVFQARGLAPGRGTLLDEMLARTGFENMASAYGVGLWGNVRLESLVANPPDLLLCGEAAPGAPTWAERLLSHPALARIGPRMKRATFPESCLYCGGPVLLRTAPLLAAAREAYWRGA